MDLIAYKVVWFHEVHELFYLIRLETTQVKSVAISKFYYEVRWNENKSDKYLHGTESLVIYSRAWTSSWIGSFFGT